MKNILITGTSSGIGAAIAKYLYEKGYRVIGTSRKPTSSNNGYQTIKLDVTDEASVKRCVQEALEILKRISQKTDSLLRPSLQIIKRRLIVLQKIQRSQRQMGQTLS